MERRNFRKKASAAGLIAGLSSNIALSETGGSVSPKPAVDRAYWIQLLDKIARTVLSNMSKQAQTDW